MAMANEKQYARVSMDYTRGDYESGCFTCLISILNKSDIERSIKKYIEEWSNRTGTIEIVAIEMSLSADDQLTNFEKSKIIGSVYNF